MGLSILDELGDVLSMHIDDLCVTPQVHCDVLSFKLAVSR